MDMDVALTGGLCLP